MRYVGRSEVCGKGGGTTQRRWNRARLALHVMSSMTVSLPSLLPLGHGHLIVVCCVCCVYVCCVVCVCVSCVCVHVCAHVLCVCACVCACVVCVVWDECVVRGVEVCGRSEMCGW